MTMDILFVAEAKTASDRSVSWLRYKRVYTVMAQEGGGASEGGGQAHQVDGVGPPYAPRPLPGPEPDRVQRFDIEAVLMGPLPAKE